MTRFCSFALLFCIVILLFYSCKKDDKTALKSDDEYILPNGKVVLTDVKLSETDSGSFLTPDGTEYVYFSSEEDPENICYCGNLIFFGGVDGEDIVSRHLSFAYQTGFFSLENDEEKRILIRYKPNNEWYSIYRKASLPPLDCSVENCVRLVLGDVFEDAVTNARNGKGITDKTEILDFLSEVRSQPDPKDAGLYDLVRKSDGWLESCYVSSAVFGFFEEEPDLFIRMSIISYNDLAYSISVGGKSYVLPEEWHDRFLNS